MRRAILYSLFFLSGPQQLPHSTEAQYAYRAPPENLSGESWLLSDSCEDRQSTPTRLAGALPVSDMAHELLPGSIL
jgi:hypothetical protein